MSYIPGPDSEFDAFFSNMINYATPKVTGAQPAWPHIPAAAMEALSHRYDDWHEAYVKTLGPHTSVDTGKKNDERKLNVTAIHDFVDRYLIWDPVTDADRDAMMLPRKDKIKTPQGKPTIHVGFELTIHQIYEIEVRFWVLETGRGHVPKNMNGVVLYTLVSDTPITHQEELHNTRLLTRHIEVITFPPECRGKTVYVACRWESEKGEEGDWSPIQSIVIP
jgi:hypothetical protein